MRGLLEAVEGLPEGFSARPREAWRPPFRAAGAECRALLDAAAGRPPGERPRVRAAVAFDGDRVGEYASAAVAGYAGGAGDAFDALRDALDECGRARPARRQDPGRGTSFTLAPLEVGDLADGARGARLRGRLDGYPYEMHLVFVHAGQTLISMVHTGVDTADPARTAAFARAVTAKVTGEAE